MAELGIKKDAYYAYLSHLDIKAEKNDGKAYLTHAQAQEVRALRAHVQCTGKMEGYQASAALATAEGGGLGNEIPQWESTPQPNEFERLIQQAQELAAHQIAMGDLVVANLAQQMTYEDLPTELQAKVDQVRAATRPKANPAEIAQQMLQQWRSQRGTTAA